MPGHAVELLTGSTASTRAVLDETLDPIELLHLHSVSRTRHRTFGSLRRCLDLTRVMIGFSCVAKKTMVGRGEFPVYKYQCRLIYPFKSV
jgi:hypothetical protein